MQSMVSAILLAAGTSERMGTLKQLLPLSGRPVIRHCLDTIAESKIRDIVVVLGLNATSIDEALRDSRVKIAYNINPLSDMAESVRVGLSAADSSSSGIMVCLSDHPLVKAATLRIMLAEHMTFRDRILIPCHEGKRGHPVIFPRDLIDKVYSGLNLREIIKKNPERVKYLDSSDRGVVLDMDTPQDYKNIQAVLPDQ